MLWACTLTLALQPRVDFPEVVLHRVVGLAFETKVLVHLHTPLSVPRSYSLTPPRATRKVHFNVRNVVRLGLAPLVKVDAGDEDEVAGFELLHRLHLDRKRVKLVGLIPTAEHEPKMLLQVDNALSDQRRAVELELIPLMRARHRRSLLEAAGQVLAPHVVRHHILARAPHVGRANV
jgi:hypothetical protein